MKFHTYHLGLLKCELLLGKNKTLRAIVLFVSNFFQSFQEIKKLIHEGFHRSRVQFFLVAA